MDSPVGKQGGVVRHPQRPGANSQDLRGTLGTVRNAVLLLDLLSEGPQYRQLSELAQQSGLSIATVHRLLRSLVLADLVEQEPKASRYGLGPEVARLAQRYLARLPSLGALSPYLVPLRDQLSSTIKVAILVGGSVVYVDRVDGDDGGLFREAQRAPGAFDTASGRLLVSRAAEDAWQDAEVMSSPEYVEEAAKQREQWQAADHLHFDHELAVPVYDRHGSAVAALSATVPPAADDARVQAMLTHLSRAASAAGRTLGHG